MQDHKENKTDAPEESKEKLFRKENKENPSIVENLTANQQFRDFFTTTVIEVPDEMARPDSEQEEAHGEKKRKRGWFGNLFKTHDDIEESGNEDDFWKVEQDDDFGAESTGEITLTGKDAELPQKPERREPEPPAAELKVAEPTLIPNVVPFPVLKPKDRAEEHLQQKAVKAEEPAPTQISTEPKKAQEGAVSATPAPHADIRVKKAEPVDVNSLLEQISEVQAVVAGTIYAADITGHPEKASQPEQKAEMPETPPEEQEKPAQEAAMAEEPVVLLQPSEEELTGHAEHKVHEESAPEEPALAAEEPTDEVSLTAEEPTPAEILPEEQNTEEKDENKPAEAAAEPEQPEEPTGEVSLAAEEPAGEVSLAAEEPTPAEILPEEQNTEEKDENKPAEATAEPEQPEEPTGEVSLTAEEPTGEVSLAAEEPTGEVSLAAEKTADTEKAIEGEDGYVPLDGRKRGWKALVNLFAASGEEAEDEEETAQDTTEESAAEPVPEDAPVQGEEEPNDTLEYRCMEDADGIREELQKRTASLTIRTVLTGILAAALVLLDLMGQNVISSPAIIDPVTSPAAWLGVHLILFGVCIGLALPILKNGFIALLPHREATADSLAAAAAAAALLQIVVGLLQANRFDPEEITIFTGLAALLLFADLLGRRISMDATAKGFDVMTSGVDNAVGYCPKDKHLLDTLCDGMEEEEPSLLLSRSGSLLKDFVPESLAPHHSDHMAVEFARTLGIVGIIAFAVTLIKGGQLLGACSALAAVLCMGAPLSAMLVRAIPTSLMQRAAAQVGAAIPGWPAIEQLGDVDVIHADASELFPPMCAHLFGIKTFQKERIDLAILYATSILIESCNTLSGLFQNMIENNTGMLYPVKDLEKRAGLGFVAWCDNCRVVLGSRELMIQEGLALPAMDYENRYSQNGERQVLYLAVSGELYAMFLYGYSGTKRVAHILGTLRRENIRLIVTADDPTLTAARIEETYRLRPGFVKVLNEDENAAMTPATAYLPRMNGCLVHLGGFASMIGGLQAASGADAAERNAGIVQLVSIVVSVILGLLLNFAGSMAHISLAAVILYQVAWSALAITLTLTKKY